jgi:Cdc6-like AAA superfamily ATPase
VFVESSEQDEYRKKLRAVFRPGTPIDRYELFEGRQEQVVEIYNAAVELGRHVILFGERGVGKTSLAKVLSEVLENSNIRVLDSGTINCDGTDSFSSLWHKAFRELSIVIGNKKAGFVSQLNLKSSLDELLPDEVAPDDVRYALTKFDQETLIILDEVDRIQDEETKRLLADTIKNLSDHAVKTTLVLVGVADTVDELITEHRSIERALVQVRMPRMNKRELLAIIENGLESAGMGIERTARDMIARLSQGLPFYTHYLGLYSGFNALNDNRIIVNIMDVMDSTLLITRKAHNIRSTYHKATSSTQKNSLYSEVLFACALADTDELGYFTAGNVSHPMSLIMGKDYDVTAYNHHLKKLCTEERGPVLHKVGTPRRVHYRFVDPLMQPFVILEGIAKGKVTLEIILGAQEERPEDFETRTEDEEKDYSPPF